MPHAEMRNHVEIRGEGSMEGYIRIERVRKLDDMFVAGPFLGNTC